MTRKTALIPALLVACCIGTLAQDASNRPVRIVISKSAHPLAEKVVVTDTNAIARLLAFFPGYEQDPQDTFKTGSWIVACVVDVYFGDGTKRLIHIADNRWSAGRDPYTPLTTNWANVLQQIAEPAWSQPTNGLVGRLVVAEQKIKSSGSFHLTLELRNVGTEPIAVEIKNYAVILSVLDAAGQPVTPPSDDHSSTECSPRWETLTPGSSLRSSLDLRGAPGQRVPQLHSVSGRWRLAPGTYRLLGEYSSARYMGSDRPPGIRAWRGRLVLPAVDIEVEPAE